MNRAPHGVNITTAIDDLTPPQYGDHQFDQLYCDIDTAGYVTPAEGPSGLNTPFQSRSRSVSTENLTSLNGIASNDIAASTLRSRLSSLDTEGIGRSGQDRSLDRSQHLSSSDGRRDRGDQSSGPWPNFPSSGGYFASGGNHHNPSSGNVPPRQCSQEDDPTSNPVTPEHIEYSAETLSKVPSYTTALQSQARTPFNDGLPTYQSAVRGPSEAILPQILAENCARIPIDNHRVMLRRCP